MTCICNKETGRECVYHGILHPPPVTPVQDYREYTAEEILREIVKFTEQAGWGDPANLGHWLGAAQRWAKVGKGDNHAGN